MNVCGIITARKGSKRLPGKNTALLAGRPLIAYTFDAAKQSSLLDRIIVSTDDPEVIRLAEEAGVEVPFIRPAELATDEATSLDVVQHALTWLTANGNPPDIIVILEPTSPLRTAEDIDATIRLHLETKADNVVTVVEDKNHHPRRAKSLDADGRLIDMAEPENGILRRQEISPVYFRNGAVYSIARAVLESGRLYGSDVRGIEMPANRSVDINDEWDLKVAEMVLKEQA